MSKKNLCGRFVRGFCFFTLINYSDSLPLMWYPLKTTIRVASALCAQAGSMSRQLQQLQTQLEERSFVSEWRVSESIIGLYLMPCPWWLCYILYDMFNYSIHWNLFFHIHPRHSKTILAVNWSMYKVMMGAGCFFLLGYHQTNQQKDRRHTIDVRSGTRRMLTYHDLSWFIMIYHD